MASSVIGRGSRALMAAAKASAGSAAAKPPPRSNVGIMKVVPVSPQLGNFLETSEASRSHAVKKVWEYVKLHNLQVSPPPSYFFFSDSQKKRSYFPKPIGWFMLHA